MEIEKKMVIVGDSASGKTSLMSVFNHEQIPENYMPTESNEHGIYIEMNGFRLKFYIIDTSGHEDYEWLRLYAYPAVDVILICFSIDKPTTLENSQEIWIPEVKEYCPRAPIVLVGNKKDLRKDKNVIDELAKRGQQPITVEDGHAMAQKIGAYAYLECSAKFNDGVKKVFDTATHVVMNK